MAHGLWEWVPRSSNDFVPYRSFHRASSLLGHSGCSALQETEGRGHEETQELLAGVLAEHQLVVRLVRPGLLWVLLELLVERQLVVAKLVVPLVLHWAKQVDLQFRKSKEPLWPLLGVLVSCCKNPTRAAAFL